MPPTTLSWPRIGCRRSTESTPFCSVITRVSGPTIGRMSSPAFSVSHSLTANSTISTGATDLGSSVAVTLGSARSPLVLSIFSPRSRSAARLAPRAKKTTSCPARRQPPAEISADGSGRHHPDAHVSSSIVSPGKGPPR